MSAFKVPLFIAALLTCSAHAQRSPTISFISPNVISDIGGEVELTCTIANANEYPLLWVRLGDGEERNFPISHGQNLFIKTSQKFKLDSDDAAGTYTLKIKNIQPSDDATYQCQLVTTTEDMITADVKLQVKTPAVILTGEEGSSRHVRVAATERAELSCKAAGFPSPRITWSREDMHVLPSGRDSETSLRFVIQKAKMEDRGNYVCTADNGVGSPDSKVVTLDVEFPPSIRVPRPRMPQAYGYEAKLVCKIEAFPPPSIFWRKDNESEAITSHGNYQISHFASQDDITTSTLTISGVDEDQFGEYTCEASNRHGTASEKMELYESRIPICPPVCGDYNLNGGEAKSCSALLSCIIAVMIAVLYGN